MSIFALMISAVAAQVRKVKPEPLDWFKVRNAEIAVLQAQVDDLRRDFNETLARVERQRDDWRNLALAYRERAREPLEGQHFINEGMRQQIQAQILQQQQVQEMYQNVHPAQLAPLAQQGMQNQPVVGRSFTQALDSYCNCVPARHDAFWGIISR
jgi:hypothetical protein